ARTALAEERLAGARFSLEAEAARAYVDTIAARLTLEALTRAAARQNDIFEGVAVRRAHGEASDFDVERAKGQLAEYESRFAPVEQDIAIARYKLARLTGQAPSAFDVELPDDLPAPAPARLDFSSDVLRQRSDVREAELAYVRAARESELAVLELYPRFTLFGGGGPSTTDLSKFLDPASLALNLGAMVDWTLYDGGRREAQADAAEARLAQAEANYRSTVLSAMEEIEAAAVRYLKAGEQLEKRETVTASRARIAEMAMARMEGGTGTFIDVLETERDLAEAELSEAQARAALLVARIGLDKALGAGAPDV
ncbi:TolC family protein, partial [Henriciella aquimarina]|uniref:TolC family protein n=1 Tax=Henriciella aquimarina TaxID=545261 RepID=UPI001179CB85